MLLKYDFFLQQMLYSNTVRSTSKKHIFSTEAHECTCGDIFPDHFQIRGLSISSMYSQANHSSLQWQHCKIVDADFLSKGIERAREQEKKREQRERNERKRERSSGVNK